MIKTFFEQAEPRVLQDIIYPKREKSLIASSDNFPLPPFPCKSSNWKQKYRNFFAYRKLSIEMSIEEIHAIVLKIGNTHYYLDYVIFGIFVPSVSRLKNENHALPQMTIEKYGGRSK